VVERLSFVRRTTRTRVAAGSILLVTALFARTGVAIDETPPLVIAFQAPDCSTSSTFCKTFIQHELPKISGIGVLMTWSAVDNCSSMTSEFPCGGVVNGSEPAFNWEAVDTNLDAYINNVPGVFGWTWNTGCAGGQPCKIVIIVQAEDDSGSVNSSTPGYVFTTSWANNLTAYGGSGHPAPQDVVVCSAVQGAGTTVDLKPGHTMWQSNDFAIWSVNGCTVLPSSTDIQCTGSIVDFSGFPVVYEKPIMSAYQTFLTNLALHYAAGGSRKGREVAPYLAYVRAGMASGGENNPKCNVFGNIGSAGWPTSPTLEPAGYVVQPSAASNPGNFMYVAESSGTTGATAPSWCQVAGCYTSSDGSITRWHNVGSRPAGIGTPVWPGPKGQSAEAGGYLDNGYLTTWPATPGDGTGYVAAMMPFLAGLHASFPWTVSSHFGPSAASGVPQEDYAYADAEALLAAQSGVGFGMQSLNVGDPQAYPAQVYPTSRQDWAANFRKYPNAPVHHLQLNAPGTKYWWPGYLIDTITVTTIAGVPTATITCKSVTSFTDCSPLAGQEIYVSGNSNISLNGVWMVQCTGVMGACPSNQLQFDVSSSTNTTTGNDGIVWSPNYWPITMPFALQIGATSLEVWECDLDYAFGQQTTAWWPDEMSGLPGCPEWGLTAGSDLTYANTIQNTLAGQPAVTSVHVDKFFYSWHF
jgi:hypothetical protein